MQKKIVIFDFDGVLINTVDVYFSIASEVNEGLSMEEWKKFFEHNAFAVTERPNGKTRNFHPKTEDLYADKTRSMHIPEIFRSMIDALSENHILAIVSSTNTRSIKEYLAKEDLSGKFDDILGNDVHASKTVKNKMLLEKYALSPADAVFITDTLGDIREATECGIPAIGVLWGWHDRETLERGSPAAIVEDPAMLYEAIKKVLP